MFLGYVENLCDWRLHEPTIENAEFLVGRAYIECLVFANESGYVDLFCRASPSRPAYRYLHYALEVEDPEEWWLVRHYDFRGYVNRPDWDLGLLSRF